MRKIGRMVILAALAAASSLVMTSPANAWYVLYYNNSYGGGYTHHCDNGILTKEEGYPYWAEPIWWDSGEGFCPPPDLTYW